MSLNLCIRFMCQGLMIHLEGYLKDVLLIHLALMDLVLTKFAMFIFIAPDRMPGSQQQ